MESVLVQNEVFSDCGCYEIVESKCKYYFLCGWNFKEDEYISREYAQGRTKCKLDEDMCGECACINCIAFRLPLRRRGTKRVINQ